MSSRPQTLFVAKAASDLVAARVLAEHDDQDDAVALIAMLDEAGFV